MQSWLLVIFGILGGQCVQFKSNSVLNITAQFTNQRIGRQYKLNLGPCNIVINSDCPNPEIRYYLYTRTYPQMPEEISIGSEPLATNLTRTSFEPTQPTKIIIHGYNSGMFLNALIEIKNQYLKKQNMNIFAIDWGPLAGGPCYPAAVWNARVAGKCSALLVDRLRELNIKDIHIIGFSLGAHVTGFLANTLAPYKVSRITGLDPAMPGFSTVGIQDKLDPSDAEFVDVIHTNAFFQGQIQESGHVDFYLNGGIIQPGCWADDRFFACNHHRAPFYFAESINSQKGFWGWPCENYFAYLLGRCPPSEPQILMGEYIKRTSNGMHLVITDSVAPFAVGPFTGPTIDILKVQNNKNRLSDIDRYKNEILDCTDNVYCEESTEITDIFSKNVLNTVIF